MAILSCGTSRENLSLDIPFLLHWLDEHPVISPEEAAGAVGVSVAEVERLFGDLVAAGLIEPRVER